jgi:hypothetical protein
MFVRDILLPNSFSSTLTPQGCFLLLIGTPSKDFKWELALELSTDLTLRVLILRDSSSI